jgi:ATP-dependent Lhr-like helicase
VSAFDRFHPAIQHHIVNSLQWTGLRPLQEQAVDPLLEGRHVLLVAPTAGGKTEAAVLPALSRMLSEHWTGLSVLYLCPLRALLNNLEPRLAQYLGYVGRRVAVWHGDVGPTARRKIQADPPDLLLTTPESLEVMLISPRVEHRPLFADARIVIVDELHAFASDDRGWHLLAVLERLVRLAGRDLQRVGLSATVGNPDELLTWLAASSRIAREVVRTEAGFDARAEVTVDYVGSDTNAATVIDALHRGEKRLVFSDSRSSAESIADAVRQRGTQTFVSHSSLSADERRRTEQAFAEASNCVIVATSTLELGLDIGDLDRVIQIDAPSRVASFLQRLGRTGRRPGTVRNCLFLAKDVAGLVRALALRQLWVEGYVEHIEPPASPMHLFAQQILALSLQERGLPVGDWPLWIGGHPGFRAMSVENRDEILRFMLDRRFLFEDSGIWSLGGQAEEEFGRRYFLDLVSAFTADALFRVKHGDVDVGSVHHLTFALRRESPAVLLLGGRPWLVQSIDWPERVAYVVPTNEPGRSRWLGDGAPLGFPLCQAIARMLARAADVPSSALSRRAEAALDEARSEYAWLDSSRTAIKSRPDGAIEWWTFAGAKANACLAATLQGRGVNARRSDNFSITCDEPSLSAVADGVGKVRSGEWALQRAPLTDAALEGLKFSTCLPESLARFVLQQRADDERSVQWVRDTPNVVVGG